MSGTNEKPVVTEAAPAAPKTDKPKPPKYQPNLPKYIRVPLTIFAAFNIISGWFFTYTLQNIVKIVTLPFLPKEKRVDICSIIFRHVNYFTGVTLNPFWKVTCVKPFPDITNHKKVIAMSNHLSNSDPYLCVGHILPHDSKWICKSDLFKVPIGGGCLANSGDLSVEFADKKGGSMAVKKGTVGKMIAAAKNYISSGRIVGVFPEGTRNAFPAGPPAEFRLGFFTVAVELQASIVPIALSGTDRLWPVNEVLIDGGHAYISCGDPITPLEGETAEQLRDRVHAVINAMREEHPDRKLLRAKQQ